MVAKEGYVALTLQSFTDDAALKDHVIVWASVSVRPSNFRLPVDRKIPLITIDHATGLIRN